MTFGTCRTDLPVLMIYSIDPAWTPEEILDGHVVTQQLVDALAAVGHPVEVICLHSPALEPALQGFDPDKYLVFNWCEELPGIPHSEYQVAKVLEQMGFAYTGSSSHTLAVNQDKRLTKRLLKQAKIPTPAWQVYLSTHHVVWSQFPAIVKPAFEHCSLGITREAVVQSRAELENRIHFVITELQQPAIVEPFLDSREFHVGVIGDGKLKVLPPAEIDYSAFTDIHDRLCTFEANFDKTSSAYRLTAPKLGVDLSERQLACLEEVVIASFRATHCRDYARLDLRLQDDIFYVLDVNPNADISPDTSLVMAAERTGLSYGQFGSLLVNYAAQRHPIFCHTA